MPVSYTHLDVYKRQITERLHKLSCKRDVNYWRKSISNASEHLAGGLLNCDINRRLPMFIFEYFILFYLYKLKLKVKDITVKSAYADAS